MVIQSLGRGSNGYKEAIGELGTGLGALAGTLIGAKLGSVARKHQEDAQTEAYMASGIPADQARKLARADAFTQQTAFQEHVNRGGLGLAPQQQDQMQQQAPQMQQGGLSQLGALKAMNMPQFQGAQTSPYQNVMSSIGASGQGPQAAQQGLNNLSTASALSLLNGPKQAAPIGEQGLKNLLKSSQAQQLPQQQVQQQQQAPIAPVQAPVLQTQPVVQPRINQARQALMNDAFSGGPNSASAWQKLMSGPTAAERKQMDKEERKRAFEEDKEKRLDRKEQLEKNKLLIEEINKEYETSKGQQVRLDRQKKLIKTGKLSSPIKHSVLNAVENFLKLNLHGVFENEESQEFQKLTADMLKDVKTFFPQATDLDVKMFLKSLPNLEQSNKGKLRNINILENFNKAKEIRKKEKDKIIKENGGIPYNLKDILQNRTEDKVDKLYNEFVNTIKDYSDDIGSSRYSFDLVGRGLDHLLG